MNPPGKLRRRSANPRPRYEQIDGHDLWSVEGEETILDGTVKIVVEFTSVDQGRPLIRNVWLANTDLVPTHDISSTDLRKATLDPLRDTANADLREFIAARRGERWGKRIGVGTEEWIPRTRGRRRRAETTMALIAHTYVEVVRTYEKVVASERTQSIHSAVHDILKQDHGIDRPPERLRKDVRDCRRAPWELLTKTETTRPGGELTQKALDLLKHPIGDPP